MEKNYFGSNTKNLTRIFTKSAMAFLFMLLTSATIVAQVALAPITVNTNDSQGNSLAAKFQVFKGINYVGEFDTNTSVDLEVGVTYKLFAHYESTSTERVTFTVDVNGNTFNYATTNITFHWTGGYLDYRGSGGWKSFGKTNGVWNSRELFPKDFYGNTMKIHFGKVWNDPRSVIIELDYSGKTSIEKVVSQLQLLDHNGDPLEGGTARGGYATPTVWHVSGTTDTNGLLIDMRDGSNSNLSYEMKFNNTTFQSAQQEDSFYSFQTQLITMKLENCDNAALEGGHVRWGHGTSFSAYHFAGGNTDANGVTSLEFFPGTYSFEMGYNSTTNVKSAWNFPNDGATLTWQTTKLTLNYDGAISYGGTTGDARWFTKPSMEMMRGGTYKFHFRDAGKTDITIAENCEMTYNANNVRLIDSNGDGLAGGTVQYWDGAWHNAPGETDVNGNLLVTSSTAPTSWKMWYRGHPNQKDGSPASPIVYQTVKVTGELLDSNDGPLESNLQFYALSWQDLDEVNPTAIAFESELLPGKYNFDFWYEGMHSGNILQDISIDSHVVFNTVAGSFSVDRVDFYSRFWHNDITSPYEFMPGCYQFKFDGGPNTEVCITESGNYGPQPEGVTLKVIDSEGNPMEGINIKIFKNNVGGAGTIVTNADGEATADLDNYSFGTNNGYTFTASYDYTRAAYSQSISDDDNGTLIHTFQTVEAQIAATDCSGSPLEGVNINYWVNNSGGGLIATTGSTGIVTKELFTGTYTFKASINRTIESVSVDISATGVDHTFSPSQVNLEYPGGITVWIPNSGGINVTPGTYMFPGTYNFNFGGDVTIPLTVGDCNESPLSGNLVSLEVRDSKGSPMEGINIKIFKNNAGGIGTIVTNTDGEAFALLDNYSFGTNNGYTFTASYDYTRAAYSQSISDIDNGTLIHTFQTVEAQIAATDCSGSPLEGVDIKYWVDNSGGGNIGVTGSTGIVTKELFTGTYTFKASINKTLESANVNILATGVDHTFSPSQVNLEYAGGITVYIPNVGTINNVTPGTYMFPGTYDFNFGGDYITTLTVGDCSVPPLTGDINIDNNGDGLDVFNTSIGLPYPNPFVESLTFPIKVQASDGDQFKKIMIFNQNGIKVATLTKLDFDSNAIWNSTSVPSGLYYYKIIYNPGETVEGIIMKK